jgi:hypothetical protein
MEQQQAAEAADLSRASAEALQEVEKVLRVIKCNQLP